MERVVAGVVEGVKVIGRVNDARNGGTDCGGDGVRGMVLVAVTVVMAMEL